MHCVFNFINSLGVAICVLLLTSGAYGAEGAGPEALIDAASESSNKSGSGALDLRSSPRQQFYDELLAAASRECRSSWCDGDFDIDFLNVSCEQVEDIDESVFAPFYTCRYSFNIRQYLFIIDDGLGYGHLSTTMQAQCEASGPAPSFDDDSWKDYWSRHHLDAIDGCIRPMLNFLYPTELDEFDDEYGDSMSEAVESHL